jgi:hypothetical protein
MPSCFLVHKNKKGAPLIREPFLVLPVAKREEEVTKYPISSPVLPFFRHSIIPCLPQALNLAWYRAGRHHSNCSFSIFFLSLKF